MLNKTSGNLKKEFIEFLEECREYGQAILVGGVIKKIDYIEELLNSKKIENFFESDTYVWNVKIENKWFEVEML